MGRMSFSKDVPAGTIGRVIYANLVYRFTYPEYEPADLYEVVIEWDSLDRRTDMVDDSDCELFLTELA